MKVLQFPPPKRPPTPELRPKDQKIVAGKRPKRRIVFKLGTELVEYYL